MIEYTYRGLLVEQRGNVHYVHGLDATLPNEAQARLAIDTALEGSEQRECRYGERLRRALLDAGVEL